MKRSILLITLLLGATSIAHAVEILRWERIPLSVRLVVGQERVIFVDRNVRVGVPASLGERLRVQSAGGAIYLKASAPIEPTRMHLQDANTGVLILLDVIAEDSTDAAALEPIRIIDAQAALSAAASHASRSDLSAELADNAALSTATPVPAVLTRYAAQSFYAPLRTIEPVAGLTRVATPRNLTLVTLLPAQPVRARAMAAWRLEDHWVTAIAVTNTDERWLELDPRALQGNFLAATFQHADLGPAGESTDTTMLYLITRGHGLPDALLPSVAPVDSMLNLPPVQLEKGGSREE
jgi:integrating conjugative element protein (TIGR03749 family)